MEQYIENQSAYPPQNAFSSRTRANTYNWHYTTLDVLESILKTNSIWASSLNSQNDTQEFSYGIELFHSEATKLYESRFYFTENKRIGSGCYTNS